MQKLKLSKELQRQARRRVTVKKQSDFRDFCKFLGYTLLFEFFVVFSVSFLVVLVLKLIPFIQ